MPEERDDEEQQQTYHKVDRRIGHRSDEAGTDPAAEAHGPAGPPAGEEGGTDPQGPEPEPASGEPSADEAAEPIEIDMYGLLRMMFSMCLEQAWVHLGLHLPPGQSETQMDLRQARLAIDTIAYIREALGDNLQEAERREVEQVLATLRMNYVQRS